MNSKDVINLIGQSRVIAIMRGNFEGREDEIVSALYEAGIRAVEVTLNSPDAVNVIKHLAVKFGEQMTVGAGTVLRVEEVERVADVGARFIVSPNRNLRVIEATKKLELISLPGCFTPSEMLEAVEAGADAVKVFPAVALGPSFVRSIVRGPLQDLRLVPTGGVSVDVAREYFAVGAWAVGVGSELINSEVLSKGGLERLKATAREYVAVAQAKGMN